MRAKSNRLPPNTRLASAISPGLEHSTTGLHQKNAPIDVKCSWLPDMLRLFLSHTSAHKTALSQLKVEFRKFGISAFVAHDDIEPTLEWQREIESALHSMDALVALLTPDFHESKWTNQEVGFALGKGALVIPVRLGVDPYGFLGKIQAVSGSLDAPDRLVCSLVDLLIKNHATRESMREALVVSLEKSPSFATAKAVSRKLESVEEFTRDQMERMEAAVRMNDQVANSFGVPDCIQGIIQRFASQHAALS